MIEIVHFKNRYGRHLVGVFLPTAGKPATPAGYEYAQRYAAGIEKPFYKLPAVYDPAMGMSYVIQLSLYFIRRDMCDI